MNDFLKENFTSVSSVFILIITVNMYFVGYSMEFSELTSLNVPNELIGIESPDYYILKAAMPVLAITFLFIILFAAMFKLDINFGIVSIILNIAWLELFIIGFSTILYSHYNSFSLENKHLIEELIVNKQTHILEKEKEYYLVYQTKDFIIIGEKDINKETVVIADEIINKPAPIPAKSIQEEKEVFITKVINKKNIDSIILKTFN